MSPGPDYKTNQKLRKWNGFEEVEESDDMIMYYITYTLLSIYKSFFFFVK